MDDIKKAIEILNDTEAKMTYSNEEIQEGYLLAMSILEKQIPMKPRNNYDCEFFCGNCDIYICDNEPGIEEEYRYCSSCGQAISWEVQG